MSTPEPPPLRVVAPGEAPPPRTSRWTTSPGLREWPIITVFAVLGAGLVLAAFGYFRRGAVVMGAGVLLGLLWRLVLPDSVAGMLVVRRRVVDLICLGVLGGALILLAVAVPASRG